MPSPTGVVGSVRPSDSHHRRSTSALPSSSGFSLRLLRDTVDRDTPADVPMSQGFAAWYKQCDDGCAAALLANEVQEQDVP